jgi:hypothetical protein
MRRLFEEIGREHAQTQPTTFFEALRTATRASTRQGALTSPFDNKASALTTTCSLVQAETSGLHKVDTLNNVADCLSKALSTRARDDMFGAKT